MAKQAVCIVAGAHSKFGAHSSKDVDGKRQDDWSQESMLAHVVTQCLQDAGLAAAEVDGIWLGSCSPGAFTGQELLAPVLTKLDSGFRFKAMTQVTAACASGSAAIFAAVDALAAGRVDTALVLGVEKMTLRSTAEVTGILARCSYWPEEGAAGVSFPQLFARQAQAYQLEYGIADESFAKMLAEVAAANYAKGVHNPLAHFGPGSFIDRLQLTTASALLALNAEDESRNPMIAPPFRLHDCSPVSDGAVALLLTRGDHPLAQRQSVELAGHCSAVDMLPLSQRQQLHQLEGARYAMEQAVKAAGITQQQLDLIELHDCFTSNQLLCLEAAGICQPGQAGFDYLAGRFAANQDIAVNLSGGLKSKGHPVGASGVSMHFFAYRQLLGKAIGVAAHKLPEHAAVLNLGGSGVVNNASILRRRAS
ncbi:beta-ketoacyl synthase N-terminal-like domain-containing protein [Alkalimonas delamerensis]|uniref:Beta-ketoacyl synthase N-terminal-like domain-containing protein n=1 Tax=Alkalimonas delamerensis TaxID=265981 RepID=A0ABT9GTK5_9GAMM|nr:beta-ketoacyl synthase N-terminal-like domain-containing protein [Alkalimonas delamerensis]MDP4530299.1 beta-ketoacyl synthase N-terminal-like domain-containing protein [Alkalimonas delamerensis]